MEKGLVDVKAKQRRRGSQLNNFKSKQEITLIELSASDVEVLDEGSLSGEEIKIEEDYRREEANKRKRASGLRNWQEPLPRPSSLARKGEARRKGNFGEGNSKEKWPRAGALVGDGRESSRRSGAQVDFEKMLKSRIRKGSLDSGELGKNKCSVRENPLGGVKVSLCDSFMRKKGEVEPEDSGYISKVDGSEEDVKQSKEEAVVVVDLCCSSKSTSDASSSSNNDDSSVEMVGEVSRPNHLMFFFKSFFSPDYA